MIAAFLRRLGLAMVAIGALAACAGVFIIALAFALYALVRPTVGEAGAAAIVAATAGALIGLAGVGALLARRRKAPKVAVSTLESRAERALAYVKANPLVAIGAALGVGFLTIRDPKYLGGAIRGFLDGKEPPKRAK